MSKIKFVVCVLVLVSLASGLSVGCTASKPKPDKVTIQFNWDHTVEWAGFYAAKQQGYYANENLEVNLIAAEKDPVDEVVSGQIEFGTITGTGLVIARSQNKPIVAVAALLRRSPRVVMALASSGIATPKDLVGKKVGMTDLDTGWGAQFLTMLKQAGVDQKQIQFVPITEYGVAPLVRGEMDAIYNVWSTNEAIAAQLEGQKVNLIFLSDYDVLEYPDPLFTSEKVIQERPGVVERFVRATLKGCQYAVEHPTQAAQLALEYDKKLDLRLQTASMQAYVPLIDTGDAPIGTMDKATWQSTHDILLRYKFIPSSQDLNKLYTNDFVTKANPKS
jgi:ABC-type nitrate/sulfonate/bicarbonate transport system substrate-binding protein